MIVDAKTSRHVVLRTGRISLASLALLSILTKIGTPQDTDLRPDKPTGSSDVKASPTEVASPSINSKVLDEARKGLFFVGTPGGGRATAFVISKKYRLLATAAHVADVLKKDGFLLAVPEGSGTIYRVARVWCHPRLVRRFDEGLYAVSEDSRDGEVDGIRGPDLAVLELAPGGPELPYEFRLADRMTLERLKGLPVVKLGYPSASNPSWPTGRHPANLYVDKGVVLAVHAFGNPDDPAERPDHQLVRCSGSFEPGLSGGPILGEDGMVVAVATNDVGRKHDQFDRSTEGLACRVDCLRELLIGHDLKVGEPDHSAGLPIRRPRDADPRLPVLRWAVGSIRAAEWSASRQDYRKAITLCNEVIGKVPDYGRAYHVRADGYFHYYSDKRVSLDPDALRQYATWAIQDAAKAAELEPESVADRLLSFAATLDRARVTGDRRGLAVLVQSLDKFLTLDWILDSERADAHLYRAECRRRLGDVHGAEEDFDESIRLDAGESAKWLFRARFKEGLGQKSSAAEDRRIAEDLGKVPN